MPTLRAHAGSGITQSKPETIRHRTYDKDHYATPAVCRTACAWAARSRPPSSGRSSPSSGATSVKASPISAARAVRPTLWM